MVDTGMENAKQEDTKKRLWKVRLAHLPWLHRFTLTNASLSNPAD